MRVQVDISEVMSMLQGIKVDVVKVAVPKAVDQTARQLQKSMKGDAAKYSTVTQKSKNRWTWQTYGRIPRAITISKLFKRGRDFNAKDGDRGRKVFIQVRRGVAESQRAPHWNFVVYGHEQWIPTGEKAPSRPNKKGLYTRRSKTKPYQPGNPMFMTSVNRALPLLKQNMEHQLKLAVKRNNKA